MPITRTFILAAALLTLVPGGLAAATDNACDCNRPTGDAVADFEAFGRDLADRWVGISPVFKGRLCPIPGRDALESLGDLWLSRLLDGETILQSRARRYTPLPWPSDDSIDGTQMAQDRRQPDREAVQ